MLLLVGEKPINVMLLEIAVRFFNQGLRGKRGSCILNLKTEKIMSKKVLVTKEFHKQALIAIEKNKRLEALQDEKTEALRLAWMSFVETQCDDELLEKFLNYCEEFKSELGLGFK